MKTIEKAKEELNQVQSDFNKETERKARKKLSKRIDFLRSIVLYLETGPNEEFLKKEKIRPESIVENLDTKARRDEWARNPENGRLKEKSISQAFQKSVGLTEIKRQVLTINHLLNS